MVNNKKVSQLTILGASDVQSNDVLLVTDTSQKESKQLAVGDLLLFVENSGSFSAYHSVTADSASYVQSTNIHGVISFANNSSQSISSSYSSLAESSSYSVVADTASYSQFCVTTTSNTDTASFLKYLGTPNGTASYSIKSNLSDVSTTASFLFYNGNPNGTSSVSISSSFSNKSTSASFANNSNYANSANNAVNATVAVTALSTVSSSWSDSSGTSSYSTNLFSIYKAGAVGIGAGATKTVSFATPFPSALYSVALSWNDGLLGFNCHVDTQNSASFDITNGGATKVTASWIAMMYNNN